MPYLNLIDSILTFFVKFVLSCFSRRTERQRLSDVLTIAFTLSTYLDFVTSVYPLKLYEILLNYKIFILTIFFFHLEILYVSLLSQRYDNYTS